MCHSRILHETKVAILFLSTQKPETFLKPLIDQYAKEGKDKKVVFEANFSKPNCKPKWYFRKDVSMRNTTVINYAADNVNLNHNFHCRNYSHLLNTSSRMKKIVINLLLWDQRWKILANTPLISLVFLALPS